MQQKFLQQAHADLPVYLTDVYRDFQKTGTRPFHLRLTLYDGTARSFPLQLPPADCTEEAAFLAEYIHAFLYNLLSSLGARAVDLYFDPADQALQALVATLPEVFQLHTPRLQRTGYGKCLNVNDRILTALLPDAEGFSFRTHPLCDEPEAQSLPVCTGASVLSRLPARATHAMLLGIDVGGTDIKLCASVNGDLCVFKEFDWFPAAFTQADQLTEPIVFLTLLLPAAASLAACGKQERIVQEALEHPIGTPRLRELAKGKKKVVLVTSDHTRAVPSKLTLPLLLAEIRAGQPDADITILIATGLHRPTTEEEQRRMFGDQIVDQEHIAVNNAFCEADFVDLGTLPSGAGFYVNRLAAECDLLVTEGFIEPHFFAGFSGGRKSILPGICAEKTVNENHSFKAISSPWAKTGVLEHNPIHEDMIAAARRVNVQFILNVALGEKKNVVAAFAGDLEEAHAAGVAFIREQPQCPVVRGDRGLSLADPPRQDHPGTVGYFHHQGCCQLPPDLDRVTETLISLGKSPNVTAVLVVSLGCEGTDHERLTAEIRKTGKPVRIIRIQELGGVSAAIKDTPGREPEILTGMAATGAQFMMFSTGRGAPQGFPTMPVLKVCGNPNTYERMSHDMDINAGRIITGEKSIEEVGEEAFSAILDLLSGKQTKNETLGYHSSIDIYTLGPVI